MTTSIPTNARFGRRYHTPAFTATTAMAAVLACLTATGRAHAQATDACGAVASDGTVQCTAAGNPYRRGIAYDATADLLVSLDGDVAVKARDSRRIRAAIDLTGSLDASIALRAAEGSSVRTTGTSQAGVRVVTESGAIEIAAPAIVTRGEDSAGIIARTRAGGDIKIGATDIRTHGNGSDGIVAKAVNGGEIAITSSDLVRTTGFNSTGILARNPFGGIRIDATDIRTFGDYADGVSAIGESVEASIGGRAATHGAESYGAYLVATGGEARLTLDGAIRTTGVGAKGAEIDGVTGATISGIGSIRTEGDGAVGARAYAVDGDAVIDLARIVTVGAEANGASAYSENGDVLVRLDKVRTYGDYSWAIDAFAPRGDVSATVTGRARADGQNSAAVVVGAGGLAEVHVQDAISTGLGGSAIGTAGTTVDITIDGTAAALGGAQEGVRGAAVAALAYTDAAGAGGDLWLTNNGNILAQGANNGGLYAVAAGGIVIEGPGAFETDGVNGAAIYAAAAGDVAIDIGQVSTSGDGSAGIDVAFAKTANIRVESVETLGAGSMGIHAQATDYLALEAGRITTAGDNSVGAQLTTLGDAGVIRASVGEIRTGGLRSFGIDLAGGQSLDAAVSADSIVTTGDRSSGIRIARNNGGTLDLGIDVGSIATSGVVADGITLLTDNSGQLEIHADRLEVAGMQAAGIYADGAGLDMDLTLGSALATGQGSAGIFASGANVVLHTSGIVESTGEEGRGISIVHGGEAELTIGGDVVATGGHAIAVSVFGAAHDSMTTVDITGNIVTSGYFSTGFSAGGEGSLVAHLNDVTNSGEPLAAYAIVATPKGDVDLTVHDVTVDGFGADTTYVRSREGNASLAVTGTYRTRMAGGISVDAVGLAAVSVKDMEIAGVNVYSIIAVGGDAHVAIDGTISDHVEAAGSGMGGPAIHVFAGGGPLAGLATVENDGSINTFADERGAVEVRALGTASLIGAGSVHTRGASSTAVTMGGITGDVLLAQDEIVTEGDFSTGAALYGSTGAVLVDLDRVATQGMFARGVDIFSLGQVSLAIGAIETDGLLSTGLRAAASGGISASLGSVSTAGAGASALDLTAGGDVRLRLGTVSTAGARADGVKLVTDGAADIGLAVVTTTGDTADGLDVTAVGAVRAAIGSASASGAHSRAIAIESGDSISLDTEGDVRALDDAVVLTTGAGASLVNRGLITAGGTAIRVNGGAAMITNSGGITGALVLGDAADRATNGGVMRLTTAQFGGGDDGLVNAGDLVLAGDLDFGDGHDALSNSGRLSLAGSAGASGGLRSLAAGTVTRSIAGLEGFANSGRIDLRSGVAGDTLDISGSFAGSGDSVVALDVRFGGTPAADRLSIARAATGSTRIAINPLDMPTAFQPGIVLVSAGAGTQADAFRLVAGEAGFFAPGLVFDATSASFRLVTAPSTRAYRLLKVDEGARAAWLESSEMIAAQLVSDQGGGFWLTASGNVNTRDQSRRFEAFGFAQDVDLGYEQDSFSTQFGYGFDRGPVMLGVTAGYGNSGLNFDGSADRIGYDALNGGAYASLRSGHFRLDALAKYDHYDIRVSVPSMGEKATSNGHAFGARIEAGARLGTAGFYAEPHMSLSYQRVAVDPLALSAATRFDDWDGGRGAVGLRVAKLSPIGAGTLKIYAEADYLKALGEGARLVFATGTTTLAAQDARFPDHGAGKLGFEVSNARVSGFVEALLRYGEAYRGGGARAGLRLAF